MKDLEKELNKPDKPWGRKELTCMYNNCSEGEELPNYKRDFLASILDFNLINACKGAMCEHRPLPEESCPRICEAEYSTREGQLCILKKLKNLSPAAAADADSI